MNFFSNLSPYWSMGPLPKFGVGCKKICSTIGDGKICTGRQLELTFGPLRDIWPRSNELEKCIVNGNGIV